ncbi:energy-coupling factor transporter transmembrane component T [Bacillus sp. CGMCC 1.16607]|uniref:energy-coupling factor transporter transmembrane component T n=1 Tax=Bacillus sp. CGMCC 1.16607 TaxID=3351842 RepID=UPI00363B80AB
MKTHFSAFHPSVTFCYYMVSLALLMLFMHPFYLTVAFCILIIIHFVHDQFESLRRWLFLMIISGLLIFLMNPLFNERGRNVLFEIFGHRVTAEAAIYGGMSAISILGVMMIFVSYNEIMTTNKLLFLFSKIIPQFAILLMLTLRFIPLMRRRIEDISAVQKSKGIYINHGPWRDRLKKGMLYIQVLLTYSLEEAIQTADSMKARGYGKPNRSSYEHFSLKKSDIFAFIYIFSLVFSLLYGRFLGYGFLTIYPRMESIQLVPIELIQIFIYALLLCFPLFVELGGVIRWRLLK